jgi:hypothetical protein
MRNSWWAVRVTSYWRWRRRRWLIQPVVRSSTQRRGWTSWLDDESTSGFGPGRDVGGDCGVGGGIGNGGAGVYPSSSQTPVMVGARRLDVEQVREGRLPARWPGVPAAAARIPALSRRTSRLTPSTVVAPWNPRGPAAGEALSEDESTAAAVGGRRRPDRVPTWPGIAGSTVARARDRRRTCLCAAEQPTVRSCGRWRQAHPVRSTDIMVSRYSRHRRGGQGRPACG